jgi:hypothetical protein
MVSWGGSAAADIRRHAVVVAGTSGMGLMALSVGRPAVLLPAGDRFLVQLPADQRTLFAATGPDDAAERAWDLSLTPGSLETECHEAVGHYLVADGPEAVNRANQEVAALANH